MAIAAEITLSDQEKAQLEIIVCNQKAWSRQIERSQSVLLPSEGFSNNAIADQLQATAASRLSSLCVSGRLSC